MPDEPAVVHTLTVTTVVTPQRSDTDPPMSFGKLTVQTAIEYRDDGSAVIASASIV